MNVDDYLKSEKYEIEPYKSEVPQDAVAFIGSPRRYPFNDEKLILITELGNGDSALYQFKASDIVGAEELASPIKASGENYNRIKLWIKRGAVGIKYEPFEVGAKKK